MCQMLNSQREWVNPKAERKDIRGMLGLMRDIYERGMYEGEEYQLSWNSKLGRSYILPLLHPRPTNGPHSSCEKQHPEVRVRSISFTIATANMLRTFRLWLQVQASKN